MGDVGGVVFMVLMRDDTYNRLDTGNALKRVSCGMLGRWQP
jgi:hypothetical protein